MPVRRGHDGAVRDREHRLAEGRVRRGRPGAQSPADRGRGAGRLRVQHVHGVRLTVGAHPVARHLAAGPVDRDPAAAHRWTSYRRRGPRRGGPSRREASRDHGDQAGHHGRTERVTTTTGDNASTNRTRKPGDRRATRRHGGHRCAPITIDSSGTARAAGPRSGHRRCRAASRPRPAGAGGGRPAPSCRAPRRGPRSATVPGPARKRRQEREPHRVAERGRAGPRRRASPSVSTASVGSSSCHSAWRSSGRRTLPAKATPPAPAYRVRSTASAQKDSSDGSAALAAGRSATFGQAAFERRDPLLDLHDSDIT